ncbi:vesicular integral-membrane protein VIP36 [Trichonephila inaurata madagascariensis]|uniref:Vesicular integral-membrane protein VIP36 n=1 Tax=Trichonephila inaurata madagascariensis TaxID=2747483 RepID=A0A8X6WS62_9ARAC|nr:vesicular integral-membrane protein VIP36 [Trichonephila inaurata madagascariensis]
MSGKSDVWNHFIKKGLGGRCKYCHQEVKTKGNTTNLRNHLLRRHPTIKTVSQKKKSGGSCGNARNGDENEQVVDDTPLDIVIVPDLQNVDNSDIESVASSTASVSVFKQQTLTSCLTNIKSFGDDGVKLGQINNAIIFMIAKDGLPLNTVEKTGFNYLMEVVAPLYKIPDRETVTHMIDDKYDILSTQLKLKIQEVEALSVTADVWSDSHNSQSYLSLTGHCIHENKLMSMIFGVAALTEPHNADYLAQVIINMTEKWGITNNKVVAFITDNGSHIVKAVTNVYGKNKHIPCFAHTLNLVASKPFENMDKLEEAKNVLTAVRDITTYLKHNINAADSLKKAQDHKTEPLGLIQSVSTRWNSVFYQLERFVELSEIIAPILLKYPKSPAMLTAQQLEVVKDIVNILRPLEVITKEISGEDYFTASKIIPIVSCLNETYNTMKTSTDIGAKIRTLIVDGLKKSFGSVEQVHLLAAATILDPRFKKIHFADQEACSQAINRINSSILDIKSQQQLPQNNSEEMEAIEGTDMEKGIWDFHKLLRTIDDRTDTMRTSPKFLTIFSAFLCFLTTEAILVRQESSLFGPYDAGNAHLAHWDLSGTAHLAETAIRLTPDEASAQGAIWNNYPLMSNDWEFHIQFHIHGKGVHLNGNGMAFWYAKEPLTPGHVFGSKDFFSGLGIFIDTVENAAAPHNHRHPYLSAVVNNGSFPYHHDEQGTAGQIGGCHLQARNLEWPTKLAISYISDVLTVYLDTQGTGTWTQCFRAVGVHLPTGYFLGASANTGEHSDNHDIVSITTLDNIIPEKVWEDRNLLIPHAEFLEIPFVLPHYQRHAVVEEVVQHRVEEVQEIIAETHDVIPEVKVEVPQPPPPPKPEVRTEPKVRVHPKTELKVEPKPEVEEPKPEKKVEPKPEAKVEPPLPPPKRTQPQVKVEEQPEVKVEPAPEPEAKISFLRKAIYICGIAVILYVAIFMFRKYNAQRKERMQKRLF